MDGTGRPTGDRGASIVEFAMISVLLVLLLFGVLRVAVFAYARTIVSAAAADAARAAAAQGVDPATGGPRATTLIRSGLGRAAADRIDCTGAPDTDAASGLAVATVHCRGRLQAIFIPVVVPLTIDVTSSALKEGHP